MEIRRATNSDYIHIVRSIQNKGIEYITPNHVKEDIANNRQFVMVNNEKVVAILSLVYDTDYNYYAMKRLCVMNKKNQGKGFAKAMLAYVSGQTTEKVGCTPWVDNGAMRHTLEKLGFNLEYIFEKKWCFYSKNAWQKIKRWYNKSVKERKGTNQCLLTSFSLKLLSLLELLIGSSPCATCWLVQTLRLTLSEVLSRHGSKRTISGSFWAARVRLPRAVFWIKADPPNFYARKKKLKKFKKFS